MNDLHLRMVSDPAAIAGVRRQVEAFARTCGLDAHQAEDVGLCVNEALANIIRHAYHNRTDQPIELRACCTAEGMQLFIRDWGSGRDPCAQPPPPRDPLTPGGLGLVCLRELMDQVRFMPQPDGMLLVLTKHAASPGADSRPVT